MISTIRKIFVLVAPEKGGYIYWLIFAMTIVALLETASLVSILPFMAVLADPAIVQSNEYLSVAYHSFNFSSTDDFLLFLGAVMLLVLIVGNAFSAFTAWWIFRFNNLRGHSLSRRLLGQYLNQPYGFFLNRNSAELTKNLMVEVNRVVTGVIAPLMQFISKTVVVCFICTLLFVVDPILSFLVVLTLGAAYLAVYLMTQNRLAKRGKSSVRQGEERFRIASEAFGGIKELKVLGRESEYLRVYEEPSRRFAENMANAQAMSNLPKYAVETIAFGGILAILLYRLASGSNLGTALPIMSLFAFAGYRIAPAMQHIFRGLTAIRFNKAALDVLIADLEAVQAIPTATYSTEKMKFSESISLRSVCCSYSGSNVPILRNISLNIQKNTFVGIVGKTGSGKSTLVDVILGLLEPNQGELLVDGKKIDETNVASWQRNIGYVPQSIYLADSTIKQNIAFGVPHDKIDQNRVERAARVAQVHDFIESGLAEGYDTLVGERGIRLSGGERQRLGIARALYNDPPVLVLDEATSALDGATQDLVVKGLRGLHNSKTIIMIAHRMSTLSGSDVIYRFDRGTLVTTARYSEEIEIDSPPPNAIRAS